MPLPSEIGTRTVFPDSTNSDNISATHTAPSGTSLLVLAVFHEAHVSVSSASWNTSESFTSLVDSGAGGSAGARVTILRLTSPTATTATVAITLSGASRPKTMAAVNFQNVNTTTPIGDTTLKATSSGNTTVVPSLGEAGNLNFFAAMFQGGDGDPVSSSPATEMFEGATGTHATNDHVHTVATAEGPGGNTFSWSATDENAGAAIEINGSVVTLPTNSLTLMGAGI